MRVLFAAYCMIDNENGDSLIGVYKRAIRIGLEMLRRGHEVWMVCASRQRFQDELARQAEAHFHFVELPAVQGLSPPLKIRRRYCRMLFGRIKPDLVVVGEAPLAGDILESALCAVTLGIPVVALDNAYSPVCAQRFVASHGPMLDGIVLTGPSSFQLQNPPDYYCAVPPYLEGTSSAAEKLIQQLGFEQKKLITVLAYEKKAEQLAAALLPAVARHNCAAIFLARQPDETRERLSSLPSPLLKNIRVLPLPTEDLLFGLIKISNLVIGKCGFMQVSECLALRTPFLGIQYRGCFPLPFLSSEALGFVHGTHKTRATRRTVRAARRFLTMSPEELGGLHDGHFGAIASAADFLERLPRTPRAETTEECATMGYPASVFLELLSRRHPGLPIAIDSVRCTHIRYPEWGRIDSLVCRYTAGSKPKFIFLWGRRYHSHVLGAKDVHSARLPSSGRHVLFVSEDGSFMLEEDAGEWLLPTTPLGAPLNRIRILPAVKKAATSWLRRIRFLFDSSGSGVNRRRQPAPLSKGR